ncbi:MAG TPA: YhjD/YihY/BrkB family envelope integrity protein [Candidatus Limnocylindrales bacterium]|nr:YhjD/YihY/BrkB family envelope integrity protein [Candidatus Limnocylindrales bacterium]
MKLYADVGMLKETYTRFNADKAPRLAAAISFSTIFAIAPVIVLVIAIAGGIIAATVGHGHGHSLVRDQLIGSIRASAGKEAADTVNAMVTAAFSKTQQSLIAQIIAWILLVLGAAGLFATLQDALNTVWHVEPEKKGIWATIRDRVASMGMIAAIGFLLLVTTALNAAIAYLSAYVTRALPFPGAGFVFGLVNVIVSIALISLLFAVMFKYLPDAKIEWHDVWTGALFTAVLFVIGQTLIALYLGRAGVSSAYGAAGSLVVLLLWVNYSSMILLLGAEFTRVYAEQHGSRIGAAPADVDPNAKKEPDPKTDGRESAAQSAQPAPHASDGAAARVPTARVPTARGDVSANGSPTRPRGTGRPL